MPVVTRRHALRTAAAAGVGAVALGALTVPRHGFAQGVTVDSSAGSVTAVPEVTGLQAPWGLTYLPDGRLLVTEKGGQLLSFDGDGTDRRVLGGTPDVFDRGQGGLLDVVADPAFESNELIYLSYAATGQGGAGTQVMRARLGPAGLTDREVIFVGGPKSEGGRHFGCRLAFGTDGMLYITHGDRGERERAQDLGDDAGKVHRIRPDGTIPDDNPFVDRDGASPTVFTYGNRNPQGLVLHPETGLLWMHEHGPRGGDEINIVEAGANYGWPEITYGINYSGTQITDRTHAEGMVQPLWYWDPSIAPCGMTFAMSDTYPGWRGSLFVGALAGSMLVRLTVEERRVVDEERLFVNELGRIRDVREGPDGRLRLIVDGGVLYRIDPA